MSRKVVDLIIKRHMEAIEDKVASKCNALLMGPSGSGKTYSVTKALEKYSENYMAYDGWSIEPPIIKVDATMMSAQGWLGTSLADMICDAYFNLRDSINDHNSRIMRQIKEASDSEEEYDALIEEQDLQDPNQLARFFMEKAVIYVDEIDKLANSKNERVQGYTDEVVQNFLKYMDGGVHTIRKSNNKNEVDLNFDNITFIFSGAFSKLWDVKAKNSIGFTNSPQEAKGDLHDKLLKWGFSKELVYRIPYVVKIEPYTKDELKEILKRHPSVLRMEKAHGKKINRKQMLEDVQAHKAGARAIDIYLAQLDIKYLEEGKNGNNNSIIKPRNCSIGSVESISREETGRTRSNNS